MMHKALLIMVTATLFAISSPGSAESDSLASAKTADWYLVDEVITDKPPEYQSEIYFADKASVARNGAEAIVAISRIVMTGWPNRTLQENIRDQRANMVIDCGTKTYRLQDRFVYDGSEQPVALLEPDDQQESLLPSATDRGFGAIARFGCEADSKIGKRQSPADMQPLTWLIAYMSADWSK
ncbi:MAG: surface-adhesin E family protein [Pseudomonadota bacterium]